MSEQSDYEDFGHDAMIQRHTDMHGFDPASEGDWEKAHRHEPVGDEDLPDPPEQELPDPPDDEGPLPF